jgi:hypothetical protein
MAKKKVKILRFRCSPVPHPLGQPCRVPNSQINIWLASSLGPGLISVQEPHACSRIALPEDGKKICSSSSIILIINNRAERSISAH